MNRPVLLWIIAFIITVVSAVYQRVTGPTYPIHGTVSLHGKSLPYVLDRSHLSTSNYVVRIRTEDPTIRGTLEWKRHSLDEPWSRVPMEYNDATLSAEIPQQPPAGQLDYLIRLDDGHQSIVLPTGTPAVIRFKGDVPPTILYAHIFAMFVGMLLSTRGGLEIFGSRSSLMKLSIWTLVFLFAGGFVLGPIVQWFAFGEFWTGWPIGHDLTDNKTAAALIIWILATIAVRRSPHPMRWVVAAAIVTFAVFLIPHSFLGSELEYQPVNRPPTTHVGQNSQIQRYQAQSWRLHSGVVLLPEACVRFD